MAKLKVAPELLVDLLFPETHGIQIHGAAFVDRWIELDISGPGIPDAEQVVCIITKHVPVTVKFEPVKGG